MLDHVVVNVRNLGPKPAHIIAAQIVGRIAIELPDTSVGKMLVEDQPRTRGKRGLRETTVRLTNPWDTQDHEA
jgi:hypothetical protein